ncbi:MAG: hypothetical protein MUP17_00965 [candidate division Zixibacteria bacterium]|nr:hypothetical protein [candidate division Zixibacteria bacterium]
MFQFLNQNSGAITAFFSIVVGASTVAYVILTARLVSETRKMREAQTQPEISITIEPRGESINWIDLIIENTGLGIAENITFKVDPDFEYFKGHLLSQKGFIKNGLKCLAPKQKRSFFLTPIGTGEEYQQKIKTAFRIKVSYQNSTGTKTYIHEYLIDFSELEGLMEVKTDRFYNISEGIKGVKEAIDNVVTNLDNLTKAINKRR